LSELVHGTSYSSHKFIIIDGAASIPIKLWEDFLDFLII
jgi:hypothetical protein